MTFSEKVEKLVNEESNDMELGKKIRELFYEDNDVWIYEHNPDTKQTFRRRPGAPIQSREEVDTDSNPIPEQLELFPFKV
tara:strand:+ start:175 stop:414 length:240 start_codon:yes stop_codon:yes gene_type:complete